MQTEPPLKKKAVIKGYLRELDVMKVPLVGSDGAGENFLFNVSLINDAKYSSSGAELIQITSERSFKTGQTITLKFLLSGKLYVAKSTCVSEENSHFSIPDELALESERRKNRKVLPDVLDSPVFVEIRGISCRIYGQLIDYSEHTLRIELTETSELDVGSRVEIRAYHQSKEVLRSNATLLRLEKSLQGIQYAIFRCLKGSRSEYKTREQRHSLNFQHPVRVRWLDPVRVNHANIVNYAYTGLSLQIDEGNSLIPIGALCEFPDIRMQGYVAWVDGQTLGIDLTSNDTTARSNWLSFIDSFDRERSLGIDDHSKKSLLSLMLRSGYLRGQKAKVFADNILENLIPDFGKCAAWLKRYIQNSKTEGERHLSFLKITDHSWMIQELAQIDSKISASEFLDEGLRRFAFEIGNSKTKGSSIVALYDRSSPFNLQYWEKRKPGVEFKSSAYVGKICDAIRTHSEIIFTFETEKNSSKPNFNEKLLSAFGISQEESYLQLTEDLRASGYQLKRNILSINKDGYPVAIAIALGLPTFSNLSTTGNHLWLLYDPEELNPSDAIKRLSESEAAKEILFGVSEYIAIPLSTPRYTELSEHRSFGFAILNSNLINRFTSKDEVDEE